MAFVGTLLVSMMAPGLGFSSVGGSNNRLIQKSQERKTPTRNFELHERNDVAGLLRTSAVVVLASVFLSANPVYADEFGRETEAPTLFTGETVMICTKRGPLGACLKTEERTQENDNDKSDKYFQQPTTMVKRKEEKARMDEENDANALIQRLRQQSDDNREKNDLQVQQRTLMNDVSANFGPFDGQVVIMNEDGKGFTLLQNPQAMRLKKAGFIKDKKFVKQPTQQEIDDALVADGPGFLEGIFGGKD